MMQCDQEMEGMNGVLVDQMAQVMGCCTSGDSPSGSVDCPFCGGGVIDNPDMVFLAQCDVEMAKLQGGKTCDDLEALNGVKWHQTDEEEDPNCTVEVFAKNGGTLSE